MILGAGPLRILLGLWFLYTLFGWAAFVGLFVMVASLPIPGEMAVRRHAGGMPMTLTHVPYDVGKVASLIHGWQVSQMKKVCQCNEIWYPQPLH